MNRTLFAFVLCSLSTVSASGHHLHSPTQQYQDNFERVHQRIQDAISEKAELKEQLALLNYKDHLDTFKPDSAKLTQFKLTKEVLLAQHTQDLTKLRKKIKRLKREEKRLASFQVS